MRARQFHILNGLGRFDGKYFISKATHKMGTGSIYSTSFSAYRIVDFMEGTPTDENSLLDSETVNIDEDIG